MACFRAATVTPGVTLINVRGTGIARRRGPTLRSAARANAQDGSGQHPSGRKGSRVPQELVFGGGDSLPNATHTNLTPKSTTGTEAERKGGVSGTRRRSHARRPVRDSTKQVGDALQRFRDATQTGGSRVPARPEEPIAEPFDSPPKRQVQRPSAERRADRDERAEEESSTRVGSTSTEVRDALKRFRDAATGRHEREGARYVAPAERATPDERLAEQQAERAPEAERGYRRPSALAQTLEAFRNSVGLQDATTQRNGSPGDAISASAPKGEDDSEWGGGGSSRYADDDGDWGGWSGFIAPSSTRRDKQAQSSQPPKEKDRSRGRPVPQIEWLSDEEVQRVIPRAPQPQQYSYFQSDGDIVQRMGGSFAILVIAGAFTQAAPIAVGAATFPFWGPLVQATARNLPVREFSCCGLWFANVYEVDWQPNPSQMYRNRRVASYRRSKPQWLISVTLGDDSGARAQVDLETNSPPGSVKVGDRIEVLVVSPDQRLRTFKIVRELFLPDNKFWISDYPFVNRRAFLGVRRALKRPQRSP
mmetsp:Transcript_41706/g.107972  ORF Transcript_41706/g.107972 Transcript_41706/m.107972 type:complete len:534 (+) Transcript_41706:114-1715(+)